MNKVIHNTAQQRYELHVAGGKLAYLNYRKRGNHLDLTYSFVPPDLRGQDVGRKLTLAVFEDIEKNGYTATAYCGYISMIAQRHPYWRDKID